MEETILLLGHGSRAPGASEAMEKVAEDLRAQLPGREIRTCHMELCSPSLEETLAACAGEGRTLIAVLPYFLHLGMHLRQDIPEILERAKAANPGLSIRLCPPLGYDPALAGIAAKRLSESL
jgi:sirohydrochlorin cobaltochelatase